MASGCLASKTCGSWHLLDMVPITGEGPGELTAMTALRNLAQLTGESPVFAVKAHAEHVVFAGHSMGGHGAWYM